jgi:hypothetical protein
MRNEKGSVPVRYWVAWWLLMAIADFVFYVLLTPIWISLRVVAWLAEFRARRKR